MHKRILPFSMVVCGAMLAYACSSSSSDTPAKTDGGGGSSGTSGSSGDGDSSIPEGDSSTLPDGAVPDGPVASANPIEGIAPATAVPTFTVPAVSTEGPQWHTDGLYFSTGVADGSMIKLTPPQTTAPVHGVLTVGNVPLGNAWDAKNNTFVSCEANTAAGGGGVLVRTTIAGAATPITLTFPPAPAAQAFDSPNDVVVRKADGIIYVTDPGYQTAPTGFNHIWRVKPGGTLTAGAAFETAIAGRPNGIALSVDEKTLYVSFTDPDSNGAPNIMKYPITGVDGAIGAGSVFVTVGTMGSSAATQLDGLAVDSAGNVYAAVKTGVDVFKADGSGKWGHIPAPALAATHGINNVAFGGADKKTLYMTSDDGMFQVTVKVAGLE